MPVSRPSGEESTGITRKAIMAVPLPFFDDFSYSSRFPDPNLWEDQQVHINQTFGINPPTLGVATFDGLDRYGLAYDLSRPKATDTVDILTSKSIDLTTALDSVYLSFFWQAAGNGEAPELSDSLTVAFYNSTADEWQNVWSVKGQNGGDFKQVMVAVPDAFHSAAFRFRFVSYGSPGGAYDIWNIDYVRLEDQRDFQDTAFFDIAFTTPHPSLLNDYEAVPYFHFDDLVQSQIASTLKFNYQRNLAPGNTLNPNLGVYQISYQGNVLAQDLTGSVTLDPIKPNNAPSSYLVDNLNYSVNPSLTAPFTINAFQTYNNAGPNRTVNDTVRRAQYFGNYYAYDDGSAERSFMVGDNDEGFIIAKYDVVAADSIKGIYAYFLPTEFDAEKNSFTIVIYQNNGGQPGNLIYESDSVYTPRYSQTNVFLPYSLDTGVYVTGPVFVGIRQKTNVKLPIGFDVNKTGVSAIYFGPDNNYFQSGLSGTLMIRPYLGYDPADISVSEVPLALAAQVYPNPASDHLLVDAPGIESFNFRIISLDGQVLQSGSSQRVIALRENYPPGIYLLQVSDKDGKFAAFTTKISIR